MNTLAQSTFDTWVDHPTIDWAAAIIAAAVEVWLKLSTYVQVADKGSLYQTMSGVSLAFLSLGTVAVTLVVTVTPTEQLKELLSKAGRGLIDTIFGCLWTLIVATILFVCLYMIGPDASESRSALFVGAFVMMFLGGVRLLWLLQSTLRLLL